MIVLTPDFLLHTELNLMITFEPSVERLVFFIVQLIRDFASGSLYQFIN